MDQSTNYDALNVCQLCVYKEDLSITFIVPYFMLKFKVPKNLLSSHWSGPNLLRLWHRVPSGQALRLVPLSIKWRTGKPWRWTFLLFLSVFPSCLTAPYMSSQILNESHYSKSFPMNGDCVTKILLRIKGSFLLAYQNTDCISSTWCFQICFYLDRGMFGVPEMTICIFNPRYFIAMVNWVSCLFAVFCQCIHASVRFVFSFPLPLCFGFLFIEAPDWIWEEREIWGLKVRATLFFFA